MPVCPTAKVQFLFLSFFFLFLALMGTKSPAPLSPLCSGRPHNKSISPQHLILVVTDIQCGCTFRYQSRHVAEKGESERSYSRSPEVKYHFPFQARWDKERDREQLCGLRTPGKAAEVRATTPGLQLTTIGLPPGLARQCYRC